MTRTDVIIFAAWHRGLSTMVMRIAASALFSLAAAALVAAGPKCHPLPVLQIFDVRITVAGGAVRTDRVIDGTALKEGQPLKFAAVELYSGRKLVQQTMTDALGHFLLENLLLGRYTLAFKGLGRFAIEVTPPRMSQQAFYGFGRFHGCLDWGMDTN